MLEHDQSGRPEKRKPVMTNANRARQNTGKKTTSKQSETNPKNEPGETRERPSGMLTVTSGPESFLHDEVEIPGDLLQSLKNVCNDNNKLMGDFILAAIRAKFATLSAPEAFSLVDFESTMQNASSAIDCLMNKVLAIYEDKINSRSPDYNRSAALEIAGYLHLATDAKKSIATAFHGVHETLYRR